MLKWPRNSNAIPLLDRYYRILTYTTITHQLQQVLKYTSTSTYTTWFPSYTTIVNNIKLVPLLFFPHFVCQHTTERAGNKLNSDGANCQLSI